MRRELIIRLSILSVVALVGIIALQAYWIHIVLSSNRNHTREHIQLRLDQYESVFCKHLELGGEALVCASLTDSINKELKTIERPLKYELKWEVDDKKISNVDCPLKAHRKYTCKADNYLIIIDCDRDSWFWRGQIFWWMLLSIVLISFIVVSMVLIMINQRKTKNIDEIKKDFISNMTHELKTPIATINVASKMLAGINERPLEQSKILKYSNIIHDENNRLQHLVDKVLMLSIFDQGEKIYKFKKFEINQLLHSSVERIKPLISSREGEIELLLPPKSQIHVFGDPTHLNNVFLNLLENAVKYSDRDLIIKVAVKQTADQLIVEVSDQGQGVPDKEKERIFQRFHRNVSRGADAPSGFGLGLSYVQTVVKAHGGRIYVEDNQPRGAKFIVHLPLDQPRDDD